MILSSRVPASFIELSKNCLCGTCLVLVACWFAELRLVVILSSRVPASFIELSRNCVCGTCLVLVACWFAELRLVC